MPSSLAKIGKGKRFFEILKSSNAALRSYQEFLNITDPHAFDLHVHSSNSPDAPMMDVVTIARQARRIGLRGVAITDHNSFRGFDEHRAVEGVFGDDLIYIPGVEVTLDTGVHILLLFSEYSDKLCGQVNYLLDVLGSQDYGLLRVLEEIDKINFKKAAIIAHPSTVVKKAKLFSRPVQKNVLSVLEENARSFNGVDVHAKECVKFAEEHGLVRIAGSDAHIPMVLGIGYTQIRAKTSGDVIRKILAGETKERPQYEWWCPFLKAHPGLPREFLKCREVFCQS